MRSGPVTALCTSFAFPDCIRTFSSSFICSGEKLAWIFSSGFVLKHLYIHTNAFTCRNPKTDVSLSTAIKVNAQVVCITKPSPVAAPFVCSSLPVSIFSSAVCRQTMKIFSVFHMYSPGLQLSERINITFTL